MDRLTAVPGDAQYTKRDDETDDRVCNPQSHRDTSRRGDHSEAEEAVDPCMLAVRDKGCAAEAIPGAKPNLGRDLISDETDDTGEGKKPEVGQRPRVKEALNGLPQRDERTDEDREDDS